MSLKPEAIPEIPEMTVEVAKAAFHKGNPYMQMRDTLVTCVQDGLGSVRGVVNASGTLSNAVNYNPYGVPDATPLEWAFTGEQRDSQTVHACSISD